MLLFWDNRGKYMIKRFLPMSLLSPLKTSELKVFWCFHGRSKGNDQKKINEVMSIYIWRLAIIQEGLGKKGMLI